MDLFNQQRRMEKQKESMHREEWRQHFDYNTQKVINNEKAWQQRFKNINEVMGKKEQNLRVHLNKQKDPDTFKEGLKDTVGSTEWNNNFFSIEDRLAHQRA